LHFLDLNCRKQIGSHKNKEDEKNRIFSQHAKFSREQLDGRIKVSSAAQRRTRPSPRHCR
jgi:hypothetical protein